MTAAKYCTPVPILRIAVAFAAAAFTLTSGVAAAPNAPALRLVSRAPLVVRANGFAARERVRVQVTGDAVAVRRAIATTRGTFVVRFGDILLTRCDTVRVVAIGSRGDRATLKLLPAPACHPG